MTVREIWDVVVGYGITPAALITALLTIILTCLKIVKYQKATRIDAIRAIEDKLMSLSVNKDVRLSLEQLSLRELKKIEKSLNEKLERAIEGLVKDVNDIKDTVRAVASALAHLKALPSEQVAELNAVLGLTSPATIIELKPIELARELKQIEPAEEPTQTSYNPFGR